jgi:hypothetical protein
MTSVVNLRTARKQAARRLQARKAAENRVAFGRSKDQRALEAARNEKSRRDIDAVRLERGEGE